jgi:hypothetical protein
MNLPTRIELAFKSGRFFALANNPRTALVGSLGAFFQQAMKTANSFPPTNRRMPGEVLRAFHPGLILPGLLIGVPARRLI